MYNIQFAQKTIGINIDFFCQNLINPNEDKIKIDIIIK